MAIKKLTKDPHITRYTAEEFLHYSNVTDRLMEILVGEPHCCVDKLVEDLTLTKSTSISQGPRRVFFSTVRLQNGLEVPVGAKTGDMEGTIREAAGIEVAQWMGLHLYEVVAGEDFLIFTVVPGKEAKTETDLVPYARALGRKIPYVEALGYCDLKKEHVFLDSHKGPTIIDWGTAFIYAPFRRFTFIESLRENEETRTEFEQGVSEGRTMFLDAFNTHATRKVVNGIISSFARKDYTDLLVGPTSYKTCPRNGYDCGRRAIEQMTQYARAWDSNL
ncbi:MAG: hypothetical protein V1820_04545 [archaeon]